MLSLLGLALNTLGAFLVLVPEIPVLYRLAHRLPPLKTVEKGEKQLYFEGEITPKHTGFDRIATAYFSGSPPFSDVPRLDNLDTMPAHVRIGDTEFTADGSGYTVKRIFKDDGDTITDTTYTVELYSQASRNLQQNLSEHGVPVPTPYLSLTTAKGAFPDLIEKYKRRLFFRTGALLLLIGFALQAANQVLSLV